MSKFTLLSEVLRPTSFADLVLPDKTVRQLQAMLDSGNVMNMLLHGTPGTGKTSTARIFKSGGFDVLFLNGSLENGIDLVRETILPFTSTVSMYDRPKIVIIDEAEFLSDSAQASLRSVIEEVSANCRFIFTANEPQKLSSAIRSRLLAVHFQPSIEDKAEIVERLTDRISDKLMAAGKLIERADVHSIISKNYHDLRTVANLLQFHLA